MNLKLYYGIDCIYSIYSHMTQEITDTMMMINKDYIINMIMVTRFVHS